MAILRRGRSRAGVAFSVFLAINLVLLALYFWSSGGQTTHVRVEARGGEFTAYIDGRLHARAEFDAPVQGGLGLGLQDTQSIPSLPKPRGIDSVRVTDLASGEVLFEDDFSSGYGDAWTEVEGAFTSEDGVLGILPPGGLALADRSWRDYAVDVEYKNVRGATILLRAQGVNTGVAYSFRSIREVDSGFALLERGRVVEDVPGAPPEPSGGEIVKSLVAMALNPYPLTVLLLALGFIAVVGLQFASALPMRFRLPSISSGWPWLVGAGALAAAAFGVTLFLNYSYLSHMPHVEDSVTYIFQAKILASGRLAAPPPPVAEVFDFTRPPFIVLSGEKWAGVYPFGHPLALAVGVKLGAIWLIPPLLGAGSVLMIFAIGRNVFNAWVGLVAAALLASSPFFLMTASNFMSHGTVAFYLLASLLFLTISGRRPLLYGALAGLFFGLAFNTRPLESLALMIPFGVLVLSRVVPRDRRTAGVRQVGGFIAGGAVMLVAYFLYNLGTTGDAFTNGLQAGGFVEVGFGGEHSVNLVLRNLQTQMAALLLVLNGWPQYIGLMFVLLPFILGTRNRWDWFLLACALAVIAGYFVFIGHGVMYGPRYWYPATPFLMLLAARGAERAAGFLASGAGWVRHWLLGIEERPTWAGLVVVYALVLVLVASSLHGWLLSNNAAWSMRLVPENAARLKSFTVANDGLIEVVDGADLHNALVLVQEDCPSWECYGTVFWLNSPALDGDVVFAKDLEARRAELFQAYPDRAVYLATYPSPSLVPFGTTPSAPPADVADEPAPIARDIVLPTPTPTATPRPTPTPDPMETLRRDDQRQRDLATLSEALQQYYQFHGAYPVAERLQTFCRYAPDVGCAVGEVLDPLPQDPLSGQAFYYYQSDGTGFTLFALMEGPPPPSQCPEPVPAELAGIETLYCLDGGPGDDS